jgi:transcriptional regulator GlxA family with amidase domain
MGLLDLTGPQTVFWAASKFMAERGLPGYDRQTVSLHGGLVQTMEGVTLETSTFAEFEHSDIDTILVPGAPEIEAALAESTATVDWVRGKAKSARRIASVCTGAFLLAQAGLLEGKRVATHWAMCDLLQRRFPTLAVDHDALFIEQDAIWTAAGVSAGIDLALALVEADCGRDVAMQCARELVVFLKRPGGQAQYSELLQAQSKDSAAFDELHLWLSDNLNAEGLGVNSLAKRANMSPRNFARVYKQKTGRAPGKAVELFRLEAARRLLENSSRNLQQIAMQCGFGDEERMRVTFHRNLGVSPSDYRKRFSPRHTSEQAAGGGALSLAADVT